MARISIADVEHRSPRPNCGRSSPGCSSPSASRRSSVRVLGDLRERRLRRHSRFLNESPIASLEDFVLGGFRLHPSMIDHRCRVKPEFLDPCFRHKSAQGRGDRREHRLRGRQFFGFISGLKNPRTSSAGRLEALIAELAAASRTSNPPDDRGVMGVSQCENP